MCKRIKWMMRQHQAHDTIMGANGSQIRRTIARVPITSFFIDSCSRPLGEEAFPVLVDDLVLDLDRDLRKTRPLHRVIDIP